MDDRWWRLIGGLPICNEFPPVRTSQSKFGVHIDRRSYDPSEHIRRDDVHFIEKDKAPLTGCQKVHHLRFV